MKKAEEGTCSGFMRRTRSEGFHGGKTGSGTARRRELELRREALEKLEELESLVRSVSRFIDEVLMVVVVAAAAAAEDAEFLRCGGTYDIVLLSLLIRKLSLEIEDRVCVNERFLLLFVLLLETQQRPTCALEEHGLVLRFTGFS
jgi:hypothetical protein